MYLTYVSYKTHLTYVENKRYLTSVSDFCGEQNSSDLCEIHNSSDLCKEFQKIFMFHLTYVKKMRKPLRVRQDFCIVQNINLGVSSMGVSYAKYKTLSRLLFLSLSFVTLRLKHLVVSLSYTNTL
jgi:hypothetical protein